MIKNQSNKNVFVDTDAFIALRVYDDVNHKEAHRQLTFVREQRLVLHTSNFVLNEVYTYFYRHPKVALEMIEIILDNPLITMHRVNVEDEEQAVVLLKRFQDKSLSYTDATTIAMMERLNFTTIFSFDKHFEDCGNFELLDEIALQSSS